MWSWIGQPVAISLAIALCEANPGVKLLAILEGSGHALETVAKGDRVAGDDAHVGIFDIDRPPKLVKEFLSVRQGQEEKRSEVKDARELNVR